MYLADYHVHSTGSPDGHLTMVEMARQGVERGLDEICFTDHVDTLHWGTTIPCSDYDWASAQHQYDEAAEQWGGRIRLKLGAELGEAYLGFDRAAHLLDTAPPLDFIIASVHMSRDENGWVDLFYIDGDRDDAYYHAVIDAYLEQELKLAQWGRFSVLGHLTLPLRYMNENLGEQMTFDGHYDQCREIFRALIESGCGIECNTNRGNVPLPDAPLLKLYREAGGEIITIGTDAHTPEFVGMRARETQELLKSCGLNYVCTFEKKKPVFHKI